MNLCANTAKPHAGDLRDTVMHGCALLCTVGNGRTGNFLT